MRGYFFTFEGGEGVGKSTQIRLLAEYLKKRHYDVLCTREPGGTEGAEALRKALLSGRFKKHGTLIEAVAFAAARCDHVDNLIRPSLEAGKIVLCDRFIDSTRVYQAGPDTQRYIALLERLAVEDVYPDCTFILDLPVKKVLERIEQRNGTVKKNDRFEDEDLAVYYERRKGFLEIAEREKERCYVIDADRSAEEIAAAIQKIVEATLRSQP